MTRLLTPFQHATGRAEKAGSPQLLILQHDGEAKEKMSSGVVHFGFDSVRRPGRISLVE
jgi:hypothetical protein